MRRESSIDRLPRLPETSRDRVVDNDSEREKRKMKRKGRDSSAFPAKLCQSSRRIADEETNWEKHVRFRFKSFFDFVLRLFFFFFFFLTFANIPSRSEVALSRRELLLPLSCSCKRTVSRPWHLFSLAFKRIEFDRRKSTWNLRRCEIRLRGSVQLALPRIHSLVRTGSSLRQNRRCLCRVILLSKNSRNERFKTRNKKVKDRVTRGTRSEKEILAARLLVELR